MSLNEQLSSRLAEAAAFPSTAPALGPGKKSLRVGEPNLFILRSP
jgi:hypothetical protein